MTHRHGLLTLLFPAAHLCEQVRNLKGALMSNIDELRSTISQLGVDLGELVTRVEERLADADVDLTAEISQLRSFSEQLDSIAAEPSTDEPPTDEPPIEPENPETPFTPDQP